MDGSQSNTDSAQGQGDEDASTHIWFAVTRFDTVKNILKFSPYAYSTRLLSVFLGNYLHNPKVVW